MPYGEVMPPLDREGQHAAAGARATGADRPAALARAAASRAGRARAARIRRRARDSACIRRVAAPPRPPSPSRSSATADSRAAISDSTCVLGLDGLGLEALDLRPEPSCSRFIPASCLRLASSVARWAARFGPVLGQVAEHVALASASRSARAPAGWRSRRGSGTGARPRARPAALLVGRAGDPADQLLAGRDDRRAVSSISLLRAGHLGLGDLELAGPASGPGPGRRRAGRAPGPPWRGPRRAWTRPGAATDGRRAELREVSFRSCRRACRSAGRPGSCAAARPPAGGRAQAADERAPRSRRWSAQDGNACGGGLRPASAAGGTCRSLSDDPRTHCEPCERTFLPLSLVPGERTVSSV